MELLLNLAWLLLALPAYRLWRDRTSTRLRCRRSSVQCLLALAGALVILFPVISATDDLLAMRAEVEESPASKRSIGQRSSDKSSPLRYQAQPAVPIVSREFFDRTEARFILPRPSILITAGAPVPATGRAPPATSLA